MGGLNQTKWFVWHWIHVCIFHGWSKIHFHTLIYTELYYYQTTILIRLTDYSIEDSQFRDALFVLSTHQIKFSLTRVSHQPEISNKIWFLDRKKLSIYWCLLNWNNLKISRRIFEGGHGKTWDKEGQKILFWKESSLFWSKS